MFQLNPLRESVSGRQYKYIKNIGHDSLSLNTIQARSKTCLGVLFDSPQSKPFFVYFCFSVYFLEHADCRLSNLPYVSLGTDVFQLFGVTLSSSTTLIVFPSFAQNCCHIYKCYPVFAFVSLLLISTKNVLFLKLQKFTKKELVCQSYNHLLA